MQNESVTPRLPHPVLVVPGGTSQEDGLPGVWKTLTRGGQNSYGGMWDLHQRDGFVHGSPSDDVYNIRYSDIFNTYQHNAAELQKAIDDIKARTGAKEVDVVAECKGAEEVRELLREGGTGIRNLVLLTPMNHGLPGAGELAAALVNTSAAVHVPLPKVDVEYVRDILNGHPDQNTLATLKELGGDWKLGPLHGNLALEQLNTPQNQEHERDSVHSLTVLAGDGHNLGDVILGVGVPVKGLSGDGAVPVYSSFMPDAENFYYPVQHAHEDGNAEYLNKIAETLLTDGHPTHDNHYCPTPPPA